MGFIDRHRSNDARVGLRNDVRLRAQREADERDDPKAEDGAADALRRAHLFRGVGRGAAHRWGWEAKAERWEAKAERPTLPSLERCRPMKPMVHGHVGARFCRSRGRDAPTPHSRQVGGGNVGLAPSRRWSGRRWWRELEVTSREKCSLF